MTEDGFRLCVCGGVIRASRFCGLRATSAWRGDANKKSPLGLKVKGGAVSEALSCSILVSVRVVPVMCSVVMSVKVVL